MNPFLRLPYAAAGMVSRSLVAVAPRASSKVFRALSARRGLLDRYEAWSAVNRDPSRPLLWVHAPSVGEGLQAQPVIDRLRARHPETQTVYTFFSPSAESFAANIGADFSDYLPFDTSGNADRALDALLPTAIAFSKLDVWPLLTEKAAKRGVRLALISATVPESSGRRSRFAAMALRDAYAAFDAVGAIAPEDAARLVEMGARAGRVTVTGDTRYDQVWQRANTPSPARNVLLQHFRDDRPTLVAGSTWPADEERLLPAWLQARRVLPAARLIIAPHELSRTHLDAIAEWAAGASLSLSRSSERAARAADVVLVDEYGILGDLYALADAAYVGGGFHAAGLHSLLEPAAFGAPVILGPMHRDNRDAALLVAGGAAVRCKGPGDIAARLIAWLQHPHILENAGGAAKKVVENGLGAADRSADLVEVLLR
ncbi:MAG: hypothetical protein H0T48_02260 [Gemmatimonadaceae bacterium]|nr:hypothetical protein [Gemmatimonadaceae bacterium]